MQTVRDKEGLTYHIRSIVDGVDDLLDGYWEINGSFAPINLEKGINSTIQQIKQWFEEGVTEQELSNKKSTIVGSFKVGLSTTRGLADTILINAQRGRPISWLDDYPSLIQSLTLEKVIKNSFFILIYYNFY